MPGKMKVDWWMPSDWLSNPFLSLCPPAARGVWADMLCRMVLAGGGRLEGTVDDLARACRCHPGEMNRALEDLHQLGVAAVEHASQGGREVVVVLDRRMSRQAAARAAETLRKRQQRARAKRPGDVPAFEEGREKRTVPREEEGDTDAPAKVGAPPDRQPPLAEAAMAGAVAAAVGMDLGRATESERADVRRTARELLLAGAAPDEVGPAAARFRAAWPDAVLTHRALRAHWSELTAPVGGRGGDAETG